MNKYISMFLFVSLNLCFSNAYAKYYWHLPDGETVKTQTGAIYTSYHSTMWGNPLSNKSALKSVTKDFQKFVDHLNERVEKWAQENSTDIAVTYKLISVDLMGRAGPGERVYKLSIEATGDRVGCRNTKLERKIGVIKSMKYILLTGQDLYFDVGLARKIVYEPSIQNYVDELYLPICD